MHLQWCKKRRFPTFYHFSLWRVNFLSALASFFQLWVIVGGPVDVSASAKINAGAPRNSQLLDPHTQHSCESPLTHTHIYICTYSPTYIYNRGHLFVQFSAFREMGIERTAAAAALAPFCSCLVLFSSRGSFFSVFFFLLHLKTTFYFFNSHHTNFSPFYSSLALVWNQQVHMSFLWW